MSSKIIGSVKCDYIHVEFHKTVGTGENIYRVTPLRLDQSIKIGNLPSIMSGKVMFAKCDYGIISHSSDGKVVAGPFNISFFKDGRDRFHAVKIEEVK